MHTRAGLWRKSSIAPDMQGMKTARVYTDTTIEGDQRPFTVKRGNPLLY